MIVPPVVSNKVVLLEDDDFDDNDCNHDYDRDDGKRRNEIDGEVEVAGRGGGREGGLGGVGEDGVSKVLWSNRLD